MPRKTDPRDGSDVDVNRWDRRDERRKRPVSDVPTGKMILLPCRCLARVHGHGHIFAEGEILSSCCEKFRHREHRPMFGVLLDTVIIPRYSTENDD